MYMYNHGINICTDTIVVVDDATVLTGGDHVLYPEFISNVSQLRYINLGNY